MNMDDVIKLQGVVMKMKYFEIYTERGFRTYKFFKVHGQLMFRHSGFNWPFVDIFFYKQNQTHLWDEGWYPDFIVWEKAKYFPLRYRLYEDRLHPVPNDIVYGLKQEGKYDTNKVCISHYYDHRLDIEYNKSAVETIQCKLLFQYYPFVQRIYDNNQTEEWLIVNGTFLNRFTYKTRTM